MRLFIVENIEGSTLTFNEEESKHIVRVLRMNIGDSLHVTNGKGMLCKAKIIQLTHKKCTVEIISTTENFEQRDYYLHLAVCPTKSNDRFEWFLEKATEIGIDEISILIGENSERKKFNTERFQKIMQAAVKQSLKAYIPKLNEPIKVKDFITQFSFEGKKMIAHCDSAYERTNIKSILQKNIPTLIMIGPEGDFSTSEIELALANNFKGIALSNSRLRTETAGVVATDYVSFFHY